MQRSSLLTFISPVLVAICSMNGTVVAESISAAVISGADIIPTGSTRSPRVHWGDVIAKGDIAFSGLSPFSTSNKTLTANTTTFTGAGVNNDYWTRWHASKDLFYKSGSGLTRVFPSAINGVPVVDFFTQVVRGDFGTGWSANSITLSGYMDNRINEVWNPHGDFGEKEPVLFRTDNSGIPLLGEGALVSNDYSVATWVDNALDDLDYSELKTRSIMQDTYLRPKAGSGFTDNSGLTLYIEPNGEVTSNPRPGSVVLTSLKQLSMKVLVPADGETESIPDRILFIDTPEGTTTGTLRTYTLDSYSNFFWKGLLYINGNLTTSGGGSFPTIAGRDPYQYSRFSMSNPSTVTQIPSCFLRGILCLTGTLECIGNVSIYGRLVVHQGISKSIPDIYFDSRDMYLVPLPQTPVTISRFTAE